jgi:hypothetical protein
VSDRATIKPNHKSVKDYYAALAAYAAQGADHESAVRSAFQNLLTETGRRFRWTLIPGLAGESPGPTPARLAPGSPRSLVRLNTTIHHERWSSDAPRTLLMLPQAVW